MRVGDPGNVKDTERGPTERTIPMTRELHLIAAAALAALPFTLAQAQHPRISMQAARGRAMALVPHGRILSAELEREHGRLIYSFDIRAPGQPDVEEIQISALDGRLVSRSHESPAAEGRERAAEARTNNPR